MLIVRFKLRLLLSRGRATLLLLVSAEVDERLSGFYPLFEFSGTYSTGWILIYCTRLKSINDTLDIGFKPFQWQS
jgi:hypothetical protein